MLPEERDAALIWDMLNHAREVRMFVQGKTWDDYNSDRMLRRAVERNVTIIGEASGKVSKSFQTAHPEVPWHPIKAQRHILIHEYDAVQNDKIWRVATIYVPDLIPLLEKLLPSEPPPIE